MNAARTSADGRWYARRNGVIRGPFSEEYIARYILLGRIRLTDELSRSGTRWRAVAEFPELFPAELLELGNWDNYQKLVMARIKYDERIAERRSRGNTVLSQKDRRRQRDRRRIDYNSEFFEHYLLGRLWTVRNRSGQANRQSLCILLIAALLASLAVLYFGTAVK
jgi:hypothetical protein